MVVRMMVWTLAVRSCEDVIQYRSGIGTETTHCRVATQGMTCSTRWAAIWAMRRPAHEGQNPRRLQLKGTRSSCLHVSQPRRRKPWARIPHICSVYKKNVTLEMWRKHAGRTAVPQQPLCVVRVMAVAK